MNDHRLKSLLLSIDDASIANVKPDLANRARKIVRRRRAQRSVLTSTAIILCVFTVAILAMNRRSDRVQTTDARRALADLTHQTRQQTRVVNAMESAQRRIVRKSAVADPLVAISQQRERAALILVASQSYQRAVDLFPETQTAKSAKMKLGQSERLP